MEQREQYKKVVESLKLLAATVEQQKQYLPEFADIPDDVTSSFESAFLLLPQLIDSNRLSNSSIACLLRLNNKLQWCLRNIELDDFSNAEWNKVRELSKEALQSMGEPIEKPDIKYI
jgi:hypothetical protein